MPALNMPSAMPLFVAAGLCVAAIITAWPEPVAHGWEWPSLLVAPLGIIASIPFWRAAQLEAMDEGKSGFGGLFGAIAAGVLLAITLLHLANAALPPGSGREAIVQVTDKYTTRGRRGRTGYHLRTAPVPGHGTASMSHTVGGFFSTSGSYDDYAVGGCMALRWRQGWIWPIITSRRAAACSAAPG
jgi:hypothetical protein